MDRKVVGVVFFGVAAVVAVVTSCQFLDVVWCSAVVGGVAIVYGRSCIPSCGGVDVVETAML